MVVSKAVLVASSGRAKTGWSVVHVVCACTLVAAKKKERRAVKESMLRGRLFMSLGVKAEEDR